VYDLVESLILNWSDVQEEEAAFLTKESKMIGKFYRSVNYSRPLGLIYGVPPADDGDAVFARAYSPVFGKGRMQINQYYAARVTMDEAIAEWTQYVKDVKKYCGHRMR